MNKHTVFVDTEEEKQNFKPEKYFDTAHEFVERAFHRPTTSQLEEEPPQPLLKSHNKYVGLTTSKCHTESYVQEKSHRI